MKAPAIVLHGQTRKKLLRQSRKTRDADRRTRLLIVLRLAEGWSVLKVADGLSCSPSTVRKFRDRWLTRGMAGLVDRREDNGQTKADELYVAVVRWLLQFTPPTFGHRRPTWTLPLLIDVAKRFTGVSISRTTMGRVLATLGARRGRAKPLGPCPWSEKRRKIRMTAIHGLIGSLPADEACVWEDEADIDLNPRIGPDWMLPGTQRQVLTPGTNVKRYFAAAMDANSDRLVWVKSERKNSGLFIELLKKLLKTYADKKVIHVVLDNYTIHSSRQTQAWLKESGQKFRLHFLPPYDPDDNRIERKLWREVHANVTNNHQIHNIDQLCQEVVAYMTRHNIKAALRNRRELRAAI
jgi:transposase